MDFIDITDLQPADLQPYDCYPLRSWDRALANAYLIADYTHLT